jgi:hypothetical protein
VRRPTVPLIAIASSIALLAATPSAGSPIGSRWDRLPRKSNPWTAGVASHPSRSNVRAAAPVEPVFDNFELVGHSELGATDTNGDVWVHGDYAYVGTWGDPCNGLGVKIVDVSDPSNPEMIGRLGARNGTSAEDMVVRSVSTPAFTGDLLAVGLQRCGGGAKLDEATFGTQFWDVTDPTQPEKLGFHGGATGGGGTHELDLFQRGSHVYALEATPGTEYFDVNHGGDFRIVDATDPRNPIQVGEWGAIANGMTAGPYDGLGSFGAPFDHSARASADGMKAYVSYWDAGVLVFDISDPSDPVLIGRTAYPAGSDGEAHSVAEYTGSRDFLLQNDEDTDPRSPLSILYGAGNAGIGSESPGARALWKSPEHQIAAHVVRARRQGCERDDYPAAASGAIVVVRTVLRLFDPAPTAKRQCRQAVQEGAAAEAGAVAVVHDWISDYTSPQWWTPAWGLPIPAVFTDHETAIGMADAGEATLQAGRPSQGFLRVFDASTGDQVAVFDDLPNVHRLAPPPGIWTIHNNEVAGDRSYISWYSNGIVAIDLSPLNGAVPADPVMVGQFIPTGLPSQTSYFPGHGPAVWGVFYRESDGLIFASDLSSGLWIVRPTGSAAP